MAQSAPIPQPKFTNGFIDGSDLVLLYRDAGGQMLSRRRKAEWSSFYRRESVTPEVMRELRNSTFVVGVSEEKEWVRVRWQAPEWRRKAHEPDGWAETAGLVGFEADVSPEHRFFQETGAEVAKPRRVYLDIETDSRVPPAVARQGKARVLCWSLVDEEERVVAQGLLQEDEDADEKRVLEEFWAAIDPYDQVVAWYGDGFDFPIMRLRSERLDARRKDHRRWLWLDFLPVYERMNRNAADSGTEKESMRLQDVAMSRLNEGKTEFDASKTYEEWAAGGARRQRLVDYCAQDTRLLPKLNKKTGFLDVNDAVCAVGRLFANTESANPTNYVDGFLLRMGAERGTRFPSRAAYGRDEQEKHEQFAGAFVMKDHKVRGIEKDVHVADFSGMYPSIIMTWNMSPETKCAVPVNGPIPAGTCRAPSTRCGFSVGAEGILVEALKRIKKMRSFWQKKQASLPPGTPEWVEAGRLSTAYKVIANSFYGVVGSPFSRFFDRQIAESVTQNGVWLIRKTIHAAEERGWEVLYTDTDSIFVKGVTREEFAAFVEWCNRALYPPAIAECGCVENFVEIAYEKEFERLTMVSARKYAAQYRHYKWVATCQCDTAKGEPGALDVKTMTCRDCGKVWDALPRPRGKPEIRGLEYKRGDVIRIARRLQLVVVEKLMKDLSEDPADFVPFVESVRDHVLSAALPVEDVRLSKSLSKSLKEYRPSMKGDETAAAEPAHVQVARVLKGRGEQIGEGTKIFYYVTDASTSPMKVAPAADYAGDCDRFYLWENLIYPATQRVLEAAFPTEKGMALEALQLRDWRRFEKVRPKKPRARKELEPPERVPGPVGKGGGRMRRAPAAQQGGLFDAPSPPVLVPSPAGAPATAPGEPFVVEVSADRETREGARVLLAVKEALRRHPGDRAVELRIATAGGTAVLDVPLRVALSADLVRDVEAAKGAA